jgi:class 3 adenylate cyclase
MLRVLVLGDLELELDGARVDPPASRRARALLGLLALDRRLHPRVQLASRFWPDVLDESARTSLRSALTALRRSLGPDADRYLVATRERTGLADEVVTDAAEFDQFVADGQPGAAMKLWRGELLSGLDDDWVLVVRDEWREKAAAALDLLGREAEAAGDLAAALAHTRRMVALDPLSEEAQRALMRRLAAAGDRAAALVAYGRYANRLRTELRIAPSPATRALADELRDSPAQPLDMPLGEAGATDAGMAGARDPRPPVSGTVTLLFTDLVGSTELLEELGDEEAERLRRVHFGLLREAALSHAGQEVKNLGDGLMVAFSSSVDASACAIVIQRSVEHYNRREKNDRLRVRVGLHVGEPIRNEDDYFGASVVVAKRLCDRARGGQILASELVRQLLASRGEFSLRPLGGVVLKGFSEPVAACELQWEPVGERPIPLPPELEKSQDAFVGRRAQMLRLGDAWREARDRGVRVVLVAGEPGIGKTRLVTELCRTAHSGGAAVLLGRSPEETLTPYQPFVEALRHYVSSCPADELLLQVGNQRRTLAKLIPELAESEGQAVGRPANAGGEGERYVLFDAVASLLRDAARNRTMILVLDDLHWADRPSLLMLGHVARSAGDVPLLILGTYRATEVGEDHPLAGTIADLRRARTLTTVPLDGLDATDVAALIHQRGARLDDGVIRTVARRTEGNPFFVEEVVRQLDSGLGLTLPESVKELLLRRLRQLDEPARRALAAAAVLGTEFELRTLERTIDLDGDALLEVMDRALAEHVLIESPDEIGRYAFAHVLIRETVYEQLSATRRGRLHLRAGTALELVHADRLDERAAELAYHFGQAQDDEKTFEYQLRAAAAAAHVHASQAAITHYDSALETAERLGLAPAHDRRVRRALAEVGWLRHVCGDVEAGLANYNAALDAARESSDREIEAEVLDRMAFADKLADVERAEAQHRAALAIAEDLGDVHLQVRILSRLSLVLSNQLDLDGAKSLGNRALKLARDAGDDHDRGLAIDALKLAALQLGDLERLQQLTAELEEMQRAHRDLWYLQWTLLESAFAPLGRCDWATASARLEETLATNTRVGDRLFRPLIHDAVGWLRRSQGGYREALAEGRCAVEQAAPGIRAQWSAWTHATLGWTLLEVRAADAAIYVLERGLAAAELAADRLRNAGHLAWAHALLGDTPGAASATHDAEQAMSRLNVPSDQAFLFGFGGIVGLARAKAALGAPEQSDALLEPLVTAARRSGWYEALAAGSLALGLCREQRGLEDEARRGFATAIEVSVEHVLPGIEWEARGALARVSRGAAATELRADSAAIVARLAAAIGDERLGAEFRRAAQG